MAHREIRYVGCHWQIAALADGVKEIMFDDPDGVTLHILPLSEEVQRQMAAQLQADPIPEATRSNQDPIELFNADTILPDEPSEWDEPDYE